MGALHEGHRTLIKKARRLANPNGNVVVSIFVNPTQFGPKEDLSNYPRPFDQDLLLCRQEGVDLLFHPSTSGMYAADTSAMVREDSLSKVLCGASRPGHFDGVCTVVSMLFNIIGPEVAVFGEKDWQQLAVVRRMVRDLQIPVKIVGHPTVREADGLAMSSRNRLLTPEARRMAPRIFQAMSAAAMECGAQGRGVTRVRDSLIKSLKAIPSADLDYAEIVDEETLAPLKSFNQKCKVRIMVAVRFGSVRLIDNLPVKFPR